MLINNTPLTYIQLRRLSQEHEEIVKQKHQWCWKPEKLPLINLLKLISSKFSETLDVRIRDCYIDWPTQEISDEIDWDEAFDEVAVRLTRLQRQQLKCFLMGEEYSRFSEIPTIPLVDTTFQHSVTLPHH